MFAKNITYRVVSMCFLISLYASALAGDISFSYPVNGYTYDTNPGASTAHFYITWGRFLTEGYYGEVTKVWLDTEQLPDNTPSGVHRDVSPGSHTYRAELWEYNIQGQFVKTAEASITFTVRRIYRVVASNSFGGGSLVVNGNTIGSSAALDGPSGTQYTVELIDRQFDGTYYQIFNNWTGVITGSSPSVIVTLNQDGEQKANFKKEFNIAFQNSMPGAGSGGVIKVNSTQYNSPTSSFAIVEPGTITGEAVYQVIDGIEYTFGSWSPGGSTSASTEFTPTGHTTYTANFNAKPLPPSNVSAGGAVDDPVQITWSEHPHASVTQYQIWRIIKPMGQSQGSPELIETVSRGTTSLTDYGCIITSSYTHDLVSYDVRAYFSVNGSYSDPNYVAVFADSNPPERVEDHKMSKTALPTEFSISNYPNPFNPSTTFSYQLIEQADAHLQIFDLLGRQVADLVNGMKSAGYHSVVWNGKDHSGKDAPTGIYLYRFHATSAEGKEVFRKTGKLLLTK